MILWTLILTSHLVIADSGVLAPAKATMEFRALPVAKTPRRSLASVDETTPTPPELNDDETEAGFIAYCERCNVVRSSGLLDSARAILKAAHSQNDN